MTNPKTLQTLIPSTQVLAQCIERASIQYQQQHKSDQPLCNEAGRTLRYLVRCYTQVLCAALEYWPDLDDDCLEEEEEEEESDIENDCSD
jgi:hypothetical protein